MQYRKLRKSASINRTLENISYDVVPLSTVRGKIFSSKRTRDFKNISAFGSEDLKMLLESCKI